MGERTPLKSLYYIYRDWAMDRGEKPMTQIAFTRKLAERSIPTEGVGSKAIILNRRRRPRNMDYGELSLKANAF